MKIKDTEKAAIEKNPGSFRDPCGYLFNFKGVLYRNICSVYRSRYDQLMNSGLYEDLTMCGDLIPHEEAVNPAGQQSEVYKTIRPQVVPFISYPYEWSFSQLKDAALLTLEIARKSLGYGMILKDSSAYNVQFSGGRPVFIDTLSFDIYEEGKPWIAYRQFCQHFLAPLALMSRRDVRLSQLLRIHLDGIPLDLASMLLPFRTYFNTGILFHIHLHAKTQKHFSGKEEKVKDRRGMIRQSFLGLLDHLQTTVQSLKWKPSGTEWESYYSCTNYSDESLQFKKTTVENFLRRVSPASVWDLGANNGLFSRIASGKGIPTMAFDIDPAAVEKNYLFSRLQKDTAMLPLVTDLANPSGGIGWGHEERASLLGRGPASAVMALALIHHLTISNHLPFKKTAFFFSQIAPWLIIEFVSKEDSQVQKLIRNREIIHDYSMEAFEKAFAGYFNIEEKICIPDTHRTLYLMKIEQPLQNNL